MPKICTYTCASPPICINLHQYNLHLNEYINLVYMIYLCTDVSIYSSIYWYKHHHAMSCQDDPRFLNLAIFLSAPMVFSSWKKNFACPVMPFAYEVTLCQMRSGGHGFTLQYCQIATCQIQRVLLLDQQLNIFCSHNIIWYLAMPSPTNFEDSQSSNYNKTHILYVHCCLKLNMNWNGNSILVV